MVQNIKIIIQDEQNKIIDRSNLNFADVYDYLWYNMKDRAKSPLLFGIDAYGDACFNHIQAPQVIK